MFGRRQQQGHKLTCRGESDVSVIVHRRFLASTVFTMAKSLFVCETHQQCDVSFTDLEKNKFQVVLDWKVGGSGGMCVCVGS